MRRRLALAGAAGLTLSACATTPKSCRDLNGRTAHPAVTHADIGQLQCAADLGDRSSQVMLAKRYETGEGIPRDPGRAVSLYEKAALSIPPTTAIYSPPVRLGGRGQMIFLPNSRAGPGSAEAQFRLGRLLIEGKSVSPDAKRGYALIERAAKQGYAPAIEALSGSGRQGTPTVVK